MIGDQLSLTFLLFEAELIFLESLWTERVF